MTRILLLLPTTTYRSSDFIAAAQRMGMEVVVASEEANTMSRLHPNKFLTLNFRDLDSSKAAVREFHSRWPIEAVIPVDEDTAVAAAAIGEALSLRHNSVQSAWAARDKYQLAELLRKRSVQGPRTVLRSVREAPEMLARQATYPCVLKPRSLSASRGVIRVNKPSEYAAAWTKILAILQTVEARARGGPSCEYILEQEFVPGVEFALEGLLSGGKLQILAIFDKPDPLDGPFFEETIYVTPSRAPESDQQTVGRSVACAARAIGLREGPVHAEVRLNSRGAWLIEIAARSIGGLCSRVLRFGTGLTLEDLILRHAAGMEVDEVRRELTAAGVMMIPIPGRGVLEQVEGLEDARAVPGVEEVTITARPGNLLVPLPEGSSYLGFIFSRAQSPSEAEAVLRAAHGKLRFVIIPESRERKAEEQRLRTPGSALQSQSPRAGRAVPFPHHHRDHN
jgi:biotin carboxylase